MVKYRKRGGYARIVNSSVMGHSTASNSPNVSNAPQPIKQENVREMREMHLVNYQAQVQPAPIAYKSTKPNPVAHNQNYNLNFPLLPFKQTWATPATNTYSIATQSPQKFRNYTNTNNDSWLGEINTLLNGIRMQY